MGVSDDDLFGVIEVYERSRSKDQDRRAAVGEAHVAAGLVN